MVLLVCKALQALLVWLARKALLALQVHKV
jgi:hypothetical protein